MASNKEKVNEKKTQLIQLTTDFCQQYLNKEYETVIMKLIDKMARKRDVPFVTGRIEIWAAAVIHALGTINFLFDKDSQPHVSVNDIYEFFNTKQSTTSQKSKRIRDMFNMTYFDGEISIETVNQNNPFNQLKMVNGFIVPDEIVTQQGEETNNLDDWELKIAQILGVSELIIEKQHNESELYDLLEVNVDSLRVFYDYLHHHLIFPFPASFDKEEGPFKSTKYEANCIRLDQVIKVDDLYGILVEGKQGRKKVLLSLADIELNEENVNYSMIDLYQSWFWTYR